MASSTPLRDRLLYLEARLAMTEDLLQIVGAQMKAWGRAALATLELGALYLFVVMLGNHFNPKEKP